MQLTSCSESCLACHASEFLEEALAAVNAASAGLPSQPAAATGPADPAAAAAGTAVAAPPKPVAPARPELGCSPCSDGIPESLPWPKPEISRVHVLPSSAPQCAQKVESFSTS